MKMTDIELTKESYVLKIYHLEKDSKANAFFQRVKESIIEDAENVILVLDLIIDLFKESEISDELEIKSSTYDKIFELASELFYQARMTNDFDNLVRTHHSLCEYNEDEDEYDESLEDYLDTHGYVCNPHFRYEELSNELSEVIEGLKS